MKNAELQDYDEAVSIIEDIEVEEVDLSDEDKNELPEVDDAEVEELPPLMFSLSVYPPAGDKNNPVELTVIVRPFKRRCRPLPSSRRHSVTVDVAVVEKNSERPFPVEIIRPFIANGRSRFHGNYYDTSSCRFSAPSGVCNRASFRGYSGSSAWVAFYMWGKWHETAPQGV